MFDMLNKLQQRGLIFAILGVTAFSFTLPFTKIALESFNSYFTAFTRPIIASFIAIPLMIIFKVPSLPRFLLRPMIFTTIGAVFGWPILIAMALDRTTSAHVSVIAAVMPLVTAIIAVIKTNRKTGISFWIASLIGTILLIIFSISRNGFSTSDLYTDLLILLAVFASSYCYVEGAGLTNYMPGWQVISWVVIISLPIAIPGAIISFFLTKSNYEIQSNALIGIMVIGISSMYLGFIAWYKGLKDFGVTHGSQIQQLQSLLTLGWSALFLGESITFSMVFLCVGIIICVLWAISKVNNPQ